MSEERFDRIEQRLDRLEAGQQDLKADVAGLKTDVAGLKTDTVSLKAGQEELRHHMLLLHEQVIATIRDIPDPSADLERKWKADDARLREQLDQRIDPIERAVRKHLGT